MDTCPLGRQVEITYDDQRATVVEVGGGIRRYEVGGRSVFDPYPIIELYAGDTLAPNGDGRAPGAEPMTCPPNAFASSDGLTRLGPGQSAPAAWGARLT